jgi:hypothetical protein
MRRWIGMLGGPFSLISKEIRFGVMLNNDQSLCAWQLEVIERLNSEGKNKHVLNIINDKEKKRHVNFSNTVNNFIFILFQRFFGGNKSNKIINVKKRFSHIKSIYCKTRLEEPYSEYFLEQDIFRIKSYNLDFILRFGFNIIRGEILNVAQYGVWSFHHGNEMEYRGVPAAFWEVYEGRSTTGSVLQRLTNKLDGGIILRKGVFKTHAYSYSKNLDQVLWKSAIWPLQVCRDITNGVHKYIEQAPSKTNTKIYFRPSNTEMLLFFSKILLGWYRYWIDIVFGEDIWNIGIIKKPIQSSLGDKFISEVNWRTPVKEYFLADPFGFLDENNMLIVFAERFNYQDRKGEIVKVNFRNDGQFNDCDIVYHSDIHMSYPFIFKNGEDIFCIPETRQLDEVSIYRYDHSAMLLVKEKIIIKEKGIVDATIFKHEDRFWIAGCKNNTDLYIWYSDSLFGNWTEHENNPVKSNITSSRPGGTVFSSKGCLYRPSQNCSKTYGGSLRINKIVKLTPYEFKEKTVKEILPSNDSKYPHGLHTLSRIGNNVVIDGKIRKKNFNTLILIKKIFKKIIK